MNTPELSSRGISLSNFQRYEDTIRRRRRITQDLGTLTDGDRVGLVWAYLDIISA
jgi:hypothetical protein